MSQLIYLTRIADGQTHHFRGVVNGHELNTVQGIFYITLERHHHHYENNAAAKAALDAQVQDKMAQGYVPTPFEETPENNINVYDQAKYHYSGDFPAELDHYQAYVHTGMFLGWLMDRDLVSDDFQEGLSKEIAAFKKREYTGPEIYERCCEGMLMLEDLSEAGNRFALYYFDFEHGQYLQDYDAVLARDLPSPYHVEDTWENYEALKKLLDQRYANWQHQQMGIE